MELLLKGVLVNENVLKVNAVYNVALLGEDSEINLNEGVIVSERPEEPTRELGKSYIWYVNVDTKEQWYEAVDRPLYPDEVIQKRLDDQQEIIDALILDSLFGGS